MQKTLTHLSKQLEVSMLQSAPILLQNLLCTLAIYPCLEIDKRKNTFVIFINYFLHESKLNQGENQRPSFFIAEHHLYSLK